MTTASDSSAPTQIAWDGADLVLTRTFDAPRELVFRAWTEREHFARWWGPEGSSLPFLQMDARPGGVLHFQHHFPDYPDVWVRGVFDEVAAPERIAFRCWFSDPAGDRAPREGFPGEMRIAVDFAESHGRTRVTIRHTGLERDQGEVQGWTEGLDRLESLLAGA